ncbi:MAG: peptide chain release factor N(5)-glutamine methyltransferase [Candidatus Omnitrophota bacterium]
MNSFEQLACWVFGCDRTRLYLGDYEADDNKIGLFHKALDSYAKGMPVQYITRESEFMGLKFRVDSNVLIPRPETEVLVEQVLKLMEKIGKESKHILDIGTGSGAIAVSLTKCDPLCKIIASDISEEALGLARSNAVLNGVEDRVRFILADLFLGIPENERFDLIISNPPYIPSDSYEALPLEVKCEPKLALDGGPNGLAFYRRIIPESVIWLKPEGYLVLEVGFGQAGAVERLIENTGLYRDKKIIKDYNGIDRVVIARRQSTELRINKGVL